MIPKDSGRKENWYIRFITLCMSNFNIPVSNITSISKELKCQLFQKYVKDIKINLVEKKVLKITRI